MLRVPVHKLQPGMILARPVPLPDDPRRFLLQRDREIPLDVVPRLKQLGIMDVWVRHRELEFLEYLVDPELGERQREVYSHVRRNFEQMIRNSSVELDVVHFEESIGSLFEFLKSGSTGDVLLQKLDAFDNYLISHSANVCYLALLVGMKLDRYLIEERRFKSAKDAKDLHILGLGCLLHDIGKMHVPPAILNKPGKLDDVEMAEMRRHTNHGYEMVRSAIPAAAASIVLNHHQRWDGSGYPGRIDHHTGTEGAPPAGRKIPVFARIATIADVYDAATSRRCYSEAKHPVRALAEMRNWSRGQFDPDVEAAFYRTVPPFPVGQVVTLSNGVDAVVVDFNPDYAVRPKVQSIRTARGQRIANPSLEEIDLSFCDDIEIVSVDGEDVRPYVAALEELEFAALA
ncbi:MAG: HD-GYP domain-containing protein [Rhodopirellula sp.]|nr:HD-GYP domain-containing protein [Rhodopirellula sp.]